MATGPMQMQTLLVTAANHTVLPYDPYNIYLLCAKNDSDLVFTLPILTGPSGMNRNGIGLWVKRTDTAYWNSVTMQTGCPDDSIDNTPGFTEISMNPNDIYQLVSFGKTWELMAYNNT